MNDPMSPKLKALVVEDQELFREAIADELSYIGFNPSTANDGEQGFQAALKDSYDIILSDMRMPNKDGRWFLNELRKTFKKTPPFIFMTGFSDLSLQDAFEMGADGFLGKPHDGDRLTALLHKVCRPLTERWTVKPEEKPVQTIELSYGAIDARVTEQQILLGRGGMFLAMAKIPFKIGDLVGFKVTFSEGPLAKLEGIGTIVWRRDTTPEGGRAGYGIDFEYITPETMNAWLEYIKKQDLVPFIPKKPFETAS